MKKSVKEQLFSFLQANPSIWHGGQLQRMDFTTNRNGLATGDNIKRRLNELVEEKRITVSYNEKNEAQFSISPTHIKKEPTYLVKHPITHQLISTKEYALL